jgi:hemerythrin superfamily protein
MATDGFSLLEQDHREVERLLDDLAESDEGAEREQTLRQLTAALTLHMQFEESEIYPLVASAIDDEAAEEAEIEHGLARDGLAKLAELVSAPGFGAAVEMLKGGISHHVEEEEDEMFPKLRKKIDLERRQALGADLQAARQAAGVPDPRVEHGTKADLMEAASEANIDGRSSMNKDELRRALQAQ